MGGSVWFWLCGCCCCCLFFFFFLAFFVFFFGVFYTHCYFCSRPSLLFKWRGEALFLMYLTFQQFKDIIQGFHLHFYLMQRSRGQLHGLPCVLVSNYCVCLRNRIWIKNLIYNLQLHLRSIIKY